MTSQHSGKVGSILAQPFALR